MTQEKTFRPGLPPRNFLRWLIVRRSERGHVRQNRSTPVPWMNGVEGEALRYVELNPVRAGLVGAAADWP